MKGSSLHYEARLGSQPDFLCSTPSKQSREFSRRRLKIYFPFFQIKITKYFRTLFFTYNTKHTNTREQSSHTFSLLFFFRFKKICQPFFETREVHNLLIETATLTELTFAIYTKSVLHKLYNF